MRLLRLWFSRLVFWVEIEVVVISAKRRVGFRILEDGRKVRYAKRSGEVMD